MPIPNLFLIGSQKGGSSSLFAHLSQHPDIATLGVKEPNIFCNCTEEKARVRLSKLSSDRSEYQYCIDGADLHLDIGSP